MGWPGHAVRVGEAVGAVEAPGPHGAVELAHADGLVADRELRRAAERRAGAVELDPLWPQEAQVVERAEAQLAGAVAAPHPHATRRIDGGTAVAARADLGDLDAGRERQRRRLAVDVLECVVDAEVAERVWSRSRAPRRRAGRRSSTWWPRWGGPAGGAVGSASAAAASTIVASP
jgi:hypothetical protein